MLVSTLICILLFLIVADLATQPRIDTPGTRRRVSMRDLENPGSDWLGSWNQ
jgi:hypothetical protein